MQQNIKRTSHNMQGQGRNFSDHDSASRHVHSFIPRENLAIQILSLCLAPCMLLSIVISSASGCLELFESGFYEIISFCISKRTRLSLQNSAKDHAPRGGRNCVETLPPVSVSPLFHVFGDIPHGITKATWRWARPKLSRQRETQAAALLLLTSFVWPLVRCRRIFVSARIS